MADIAVGINGRQFWLGIVAICLSVGGSILYRVEEEAAFKATIELRVSRLEIAANSQGVWQSEYSRDLAPILEAWKRDEFELRADGK